MILKITRENDKIAIKNGSELIEDYSMSESIDFHRFMSFLLKNDLSDEIEFDVSDFEPNEQDVPLLNLINEIKDNYNNKVVEYDAFKKDFDKKHS